MEFKDLKERKEVELRKMLAESLSKWHDTRLKLSIGQLKDVSAHKKVRSEIAKILTRLNQIAK